MDHNESDQGGSLVVYILFSLLWSQVNASEMPMPQVYASPLAAKVSTEASAPHSLVTAFTTAITFPQPLMFGIQTHRSDTPNWDAFYEAGFFKYPLTSSKRSGADYSMELGVRYHPFSNWFYACSELGFRHIGLNVDISNLKQDGVALASTAQGSIGTFFTGLLVGGEWHLSKGVAIAFDLGYQFALLHTGSITIVTDPSQNDGTDNSVDDSKEMKRISGLPIPQIALLRLVWYI